MYQVFQLKQSNTEVVCSDRLICPMSMSPKSAALPVTVKMPNCKATEKLFRENKKKLCFINVSALMVATRLGYGTKALG